MVTASYRLPKNSDREKTMTSTLQATPEDNARKMWLTNRTKARLRGEDIPFAARNFLKKTEQSGIELDTDAYIARRERTSTAAVQYYRKAL